MAIKIINSIDIVYFIIAYLVFMGYMGTIK